MFPCDVQQTTAFTHSHISLSFSVEYTVKIWPKLQIRNLHFFTFKIFSAYLKRNNLLLKTDRCKHGLKKRSFKRNIFLKNCRNRFKSFEVCMGFCGSERPEAVPTEPGSDLEPSPPPPPAHPGKITHRLQCDRMLI